MTVVKFFILLLVFLWLPAPGAAESVVETTLPNGLKVLLVEDHRSPIVTIQVWYRVGSRNETPGATGLSHLLEHMMFKGTPAYGPRTYATLIEQAGGRDNAFTTQDHTAYFVNIAADKADLVLELEADRMRHLLLNPKDVDSERQVVMEERRTRTEDDPEGFLGEEVSALAFKAHPYRGPIIGWMEDLKRITVDELRAYYRTHYVPNNALLVAVGDFQAPAMLEKVARHFGSIPRGPDPPPVRAVEPPQTGERRVTVKKDAQLPVIYIGYHVPNYRSGDAYALELLSTILSQGRRSRLHQRLIYERRLALNAGGDYSDFSADPNLFWFWATPLPGQSVETVEAALMEEVERVKSDLVSEEELARAKNQIEASFVFRQDSIFSRARVLAGFDLTSGWRALDRFVPAIRAVTAQDLQRVARLYFPADRRTVGILLPLPSAEAPSRTP
jgi:zinc protease